MDSGLSLLNVLSLDDLFKFITRMHSSSRMRTVRCSDRLRGRGGGCLPGEGLPGGCLPGGCLPRGCLPGGCLPWGRGVSVQIEPANACTTLQAAILQALN